MNRRENYALRAFLLLGFLSSIFATPTTITAPPVADNVVSNDKDDLKQFFGHCLHRKDVTKCLKHRVIDVIDDVTQSEDPLSLNLFNINMSLNKNPHFEESNHAADTSRTFEDIISRKLKNLIESRVIQVKLVDDSKEHSDEARKKKDGGKHGHTMMMSGKSSSIAYSPIWTKFVLI